MSGEKTPNAISKRPYKKPLIRIIELHAEEVLGVGCKVDGGPGPTLSCLAAPCNAPGS